MPPHNVPTSEGSACRGQLAELVISCGRGDEAALKSLFDILYPQVSRLGSEDDVVAAFVRLWRQAPRYDGREGAVDWIMRVIALSPVSQAVAEVNQPIDSTIRLGHS